jgi:hypothetical protein
MVIMYTITLSREFFKTCPPNQNWASEKLSWAESSSAHHSSEKASNQDPDQETIHQAFMGYLSRSVVFCRFPSQCTQTTYLCTARNFSQLCGCSWCFKIAHVKENFTRIPVGKVCMCGSVSAPIQSY